MRSCKDEVFSSSPLWDSSQPQSRKRKKEESYNKELERILPRYGAFVHSQIMLITCHIFWIVHCLLFACLHSIYYHHVLGSLEFKFSLSFSISGTTLDTFTFNFKIYSSHQSFILFFKKPHSILSINTLLNIYKHICLAPHNKNTLPILLNSCVIQWLYNTLTFVTLK